MISRIPVGNEVIDLAAARYIRMGGDIVAGESIDIARFSSVGRAQHDVADGVGSPVLKRITTLKGFEPILEIRDVA